MKISGIIMLLVFSVPAASAPLMKINRLETDLGQAKAGAVLSDSSFSIKNQGDAPLDCKVRSTCGCLTVYPDRFSLSPGKKVSLKIILDTADEEGNLKKFFYLLTNDPRFPSVPLTVLARVRPREKTKQTSSGTVPGPSGVLEGSAAFHYFFSFTCRQCLDVKESFFPDLSRRLKKKFLVKSHNLDKKESFALLLSFRERFGPGEDALPVVVLGRKYIAGLDRIQKELPLLLSGKEAYPLIPEKEIRRSSPALIRLSFWPVLSAGLLDGVNPCAFATIIFLISYLSFLKKSRTTILLSGLFFSLAVFVTYFLTGLGLLSGLRGLPFFVRISRYFFMLLSLFTLFLAYRSFRDFLLARQGRFGEMSLQLSSGIKKRIHQSIRTESRKGWLIGSSLALGAAVSFFELACTGQVYFPALVYMTRLDPYKAVLYLFFYNLLFVLPLLIIFALFYQGVSSERIAAFFQKKVAIIKLLTTLMFVVLSLVLFFNAL